VLCDDEPVPLEFAEPVAPVPLVEPGAVLIDPEVDGLVPEVLEDVLSCVVELVDGGIDVPLLDVLLLVLPPGVVLPAVPPPGVVLEDVLLESRVVVVTSSRFVQAASDASAINVMAPAWAIFKAVMADSFGRLQGLGRRACRCSSPPACAPSGGGRLRAQAARKTPSFQCVTRVGGWCSGHSGCPYPGVAGALLRALPAISSPAHAAVTYRKEIQMGQQNQGNQQGGQNQDDKQQKNERGMANQGGAGQAGSQSQSGNTSGGRGGQQMPGSSGQGGEGGEGLERSSASKGSDAGQQGGGAGQQGSGQSGQGDRGMASDRGMADRGSSGQGSGSGTSGSPGAGGKSGSRG
jgi:hypothetical protein